MNITLFTLKTITFAIGLDWIAKIFIIGFESNIIKETVAQISNSDDYYEKLTEIIKLQNPLTTKPIVLLILLEKMHYIILEKYNIMTLIQK